MTETVVTIPLLAILTAFGSGLVLLMGWLWSIERRKADRTELAAAIHTVVARQTEMHLENKEHRFEVLEEMRSIRTDIQKMAVGMRHVERCPYLEDVKRQADT